MKKTIAQVAQTDISVLILGESGTGKELVARAIHSLSSRKNHEMVAFNCGSFSEDLMANELFGHEKEAFTGAIATYHTAPEGKIPTMKEQEKRYIQWVLEQTNWNKTRAAEIMKIDRVSLWRKIKAFKLQ